jgi:VIT1/CCC1 family predicted Fe2+/Mn2+ transporter
VVTFFSFAIFGLVPLAAFIAVLLVPLVKFDAFTVAGLLTAITLFALGAIKVRITGKNWFKSGLETLLVGGLAAAAAYAVGRLLGGLA